MQKGPRWVSRGYISDGSCVDLMIFISNPSTCSRFLLKIYLENKMFYKNNNILLGSAWMNVE